VGDRHGGFPHIEPPLEVEGNAPVFGKRAEFQLMLETGGVEVVDIDSALQEEVDSNALLDAGVGEGSHAVAAEEQYVDVREETPRAVDTVAKEGYAVVEEGKQRYVVEFERNLDQVHVIAMVHPLEPSVAV